MRWSLHRQRPQGLLLHRRQAVRCRQAHASSSSTARSTTTASGSCRAAGSRTTAGTCWRSTCRAIAAATARRPRASRRPPASSLGAARRRRRRPRRAGRPQHGLADRARGGRAAKERVTHLVMVGTAYPMKVSAALLEASLHEPHEGAADDQRLFAQHAGRRRPPRWDPAPGSTARAWRWAGGCWRAIRGSTSSTAASRPATAMPNGEAAMAAVHLPGAVRARRAGPDDAAEGRAAR